MTESQSPLSMLLFRHTKRRSFLTLLGGAAAASPIAAQAQQSASGRGNRVRKIGIILQGGPWHSVIDGLREGLNRSGLKEGASFALDIRDTGGNLKAAENAAEELEQQRADLIFTAATSVSLAVQRATSTVPIVFFAGTDPVAVHLVESIARPGGRLTGVHTPITHVTGKRLELLREIVPKMQRVLTFFDPGNPAALASIKETREAADHLAVRLLERQARSIDELKMLLRTVGTGEADAYFAVSDAMLDRESQAVLEMTKANRLPSMFYLQNVVVDGGLASYSPDFREGGRLSATYVLRVLDGAHPGDLPVEQMDKLIFVINLKTAKQIGLAIPESILVRADQVIE
jgi:ABC-type uncharacterized transport system substrate-binding protein